METTIKTFEDACAFLKISEDTPDVSMIPQRFRARIISDYKLCVIHEALNKERDRKWKPDYHSQNTKYYNYFQVKATKDKPAGVGFSFAYCGVWDAATTVGSRLALATADLVHYSNKQFEKLHIDHQIK